MLLLSLSTLAADPPKSDDFADKSIEELMNVDVTSVGRKGQKLSKVPAAVYVITQEAIQRSGATIIPDLLRMVPGVQVAQVESNRWAISVRGFNGVYSNKLLVLVDGRAIYTPAFSGVYWDQLNIPLETIERIEVIRGAGAATWGANAVNGVINIITKKPTDNAGLSVSVGAGSHDTGQYQAIYGGKLGDSVSYRAYGGYSSFGSYRSSVTGKNADDDWQAQYGGLRADIRLSAKDSIFVEGDASANTGNSLITNFTNVAGASVPLLLQNIRGDITGRWTHSHSETSESSLQIFESAFTRHDTGFLEHVNVVDFDFQNHTLVGLHNDLVWGAGFRTTNDSTVQSLTRIQSFSLLGGFPQLNPPTERLNLGSGFAQDEILLPSNVALTLGAKAEHYTFSGFDFEPSARLAWTPTSNSTYWLAASRAARFPSRLDRDVNISFPTEPLSANVSVTQPYFGTKTFRPEYVDDFEAGYRIIPAARLSLDLTAFYSLYSHLSDTTLGPPQISSSAPQQLLIALPILTVNGPSSRQTGAEAVVTWNAARHWKLTGTYSYLHVHFSDFNDQSNFDTAVQKVSTVLPPAFAQGLISGFAAALPLPDVATAPSHQSSIQSFLDLGKRASFDTSLYLIGAIAPGAVKSYERLDQRLAYKLRANIEASIVGQNLLSPTHVEFMSSEQAVPTLIERSIFGKLTFHF